MALRKMIEFDSIVYLMNLIDTIQSNMEDNGLIEVGYIYFDGDGEGDGASFGFPKSSYAKGLGSSYAKGLGLSD